MGWGLGREEEREAPPTPAWLRERVLSEILNALGPWVPPQRPPPPHPADPCGLTSSRSRWWFVVSSKAWAPGHGSQPTSRPQATS